MLSHLNKYKILLGSNSPRRKELLKGLDIDFEVRVIQGIDESYPSDICNSDIALYLANKKASHYQLLENELLITADTIVILKDETILGKPSDIQASREMLKKLSGCTHKVATGVCLKSYHTILSFVDVSEVKFSDLSDKEITYYTLKYKPLDKAGSYGIQEWIGYIGIEGIKGSYFNIMGLPTDKLYQALKTFDR